MVTTTPTATVPAVTTHKAETRPAVDVLRAYRWVILMAAFGVATLAVAFTVGGGFAWFESGALLMGSLMAWRNTKDARQEAREWAAVRAEYEKEATA